MIKLGKTHEELEHKLVELADIKVEAATVEKRNVAAYKVKLVTLENIEVKRKMLIEKSAHAKFRREIRKMCDDFKSYVQIYRNQIWKNSIGKEVEVMELDDGKFERDFTIREVADTGMRIKKGYSYRTIQLHELTQEMKEEYLMGKTPAEQYIADFERRNFSLYEEGFTPDETGEFSNSMLFYIWGMLRLFSNDVGRAMFSEGLRRHSHQR